MRLDRERVQRAIEEAEQTTSGEIVVSVAPFFWGSVRRAAERAFVKLGIARTRDRTGVLVFVVPSRRQLFVLGDEGVHAKVGDAFWESVASEIARQMRSDRTQALVDGVARIGRALAEHFPPRPDDTNELPDTVR